MSEVTLSQEPKTLAQALLVAQSICKPVPKADMADVGKYKYKFASGEDIIAAAISAFNAAGLTIELVSWEFESPPEWMAREIKDDKGNVRADPGDPLLVTRFELTHAASGQSKHYTFKMPISMQGGWDKATAGALTYSTSYAYRGILSLPKVEEESHEPDKRKPDQERPRSETKPVAAVKSSPAQKSNGKDSTTLLAGWIDAAKRAAAAWKDESGEGWDSIVNTCCEELGFHLELQNPLHFIAVHTWVYVERYRTRHSLTWAETKAEYEVQRGTKYEFRADSLIHMEKWLREELAKPAPVKDKGPPANWEPGQTPH